jgi:outer membrane PBP1 activator LpoA protein
MSRFNAILLLAIASWVLPAFSADEPSSTTTRARIIGNPPAPLPDDDDIDPATGLARSSVVRPLRDVPPVPDQRVPVARVPGGGRPHIALILPTTSPALGRLADAVRLGFQAAAEAEGRNAPPVVVTAVENEGTALLEACRNAQAAGAFLVVAALTRDGATSLARSDCPRQPTLALNEPQQLGPGDMPANLFTVSLSLENEARQVAHQAVADGWRSAIVIHSPSPLARRVQDAFEREWSRAAGEIRRAPFSGNLEDAQNIRERLANMRGDMVFFALEPIEARAVRPYVSGTLPIYATSMSVNPRAETLVNLDLQGVRYVEMPWFVQPDHPAVMAYSLPKTPMSVEQERLYALGIDAYRLALQMLRTQRVPLDGVTGRIQLDQPNQFSRTLTPAEVDGGRVIPLRAP